MVLAFYLLVIEILGIQAQYVPNVPSQWDTLGPFPAGMREIVADPINAYGTNFKLPFTISHKSQVVFFK